MARVLIVGCGCRGRMLAGALIADGHAVRGTTRDPAMLGEIEAVGAAGVLADPDRLATLMPALEQVSALCWLMASATGTPERVAALHGPRLRSLLEALVDTHVRGVVYEAAGDVDGELLAAGTVIVDEIAHTFRMPSRSVEADPADHPAWVSAMSEAVAGVLAG